MKYRLKDRELQKKLDEISDGDFSARLHKERELIKDSFKKEPRLHVLWFGEGSQFSAALYADMLEEVREYDPHGWNSFPEVEPPRGLPLRLEVKEKDQNTGTPEPYYGKTLFQGFAVFDGHDFIPFGSFHRLPIFWDGRLDAFGREDVTARYAPWGDEE